MNEDESTQSLSDKVLDRANLLRFAAPKADDVLLSAKANSERRPGEADESQLPVSEALSRQVWLQWVDGELSTDERAAAGDKITAMVDLMTRFSRPIGFRLGNSIMAYVAAYPKIEGIGDHVKTALADQIEMRLLPRLRGVELEEMSSAFIDLQELAKRLDDDVLADAIGKSVKAADTTGQFVWQGATRQ